MSKSDQAIARPSATISSKNDTTAPSLPDTARPIASLSLRETLTTEYGIIKQGTLSARSGWKLYRLDYHGVLIQLASWPDFVFVPMHEVRCLAATPKP